MRLVRWVTQHYLASLLGTALFGAAVTGTVYFLTRPETTSFQLAEATELPPPPRAKLPPAPPSDAPLAELAAWVRPQPEEYHWLDLPWQKSIVKAQELARKTRRLVFLWGTNAPVGRC